MLSFQDCLDLADVTESEIAAILAHEGIPPIVALELGHYLLQTKEGREKLQGFIVDDILAAQVRHSCDTCESFSRTLSQYLKRCAARDGSGMTVLPGSSELAAIGEAQEMVENAETAESADHRTVGSLQKAKDCDDCCACAKLSLELVAALRQNDAD